MARTGGFLNVRNILLCVGALAVVYIMFLRSKEAEVQATIPPNRLRDFETTDPTESAHYPVAVPALFRVRMTTTKGDIVFELERELAPLGVSQVHRMVSEGFFDHGIGIFRCVKKFVVQFGIHGEPSVSAIWRGRHISDDPVKSSNVRGTLTFASAGPNTRTSQLFINLVDNVSLDKAGFSPLGKCVEGCEVMDKLNFEYGEKPNQGTIQNKGNDYLHASFPNLDYITKAVIE